MIVCRSEQKPRDPEDFCSMVFKRIHIDSHKSTGIEDTDERILARNLYNPTEEKRPLEESHNLYNP